jgi:hypothetical protein
MDGILGLLAAGIGAAIDPIALGLAVAAFAALERWLGGKAARWLTPITAALVALAMSVLVISITKNVWPNISVVQIFWPKWAAGMYHQWGFVAVRAAVHALRRR